MDYSSLSSIDIGIYLNNSFCQILVLVSKKQNFHINHKSR